MLPEFIGAAGVKAPTRLVSAFTLREIGTQ
jgi:hypothetical protein